MRVILTERNRIEVVLVVLGDPPVGVLHRPHVMIQDSLDYGTSQLRGERRVLQYDPVVWLYRKIAVIEFYEVTALVLSGIFGPPRVGGVRLRPVPVERHHVDALMLLFVPVQVLHPHTAQRMENGDGDVGRK